MMGVDLKVGTFAFGAISMVLPGRAKPLMTRDLVAAFSTKRAAMLARDKSVLAYWYAQLTVHPAHGRSMR